MKSVGNVNITLWNLHRTEPSWGWLPMGASNTRPDRAHQNTQVSLYCLLPSTCFSYPKTNFPPGSKAQLICTSKALRMQGRQSPPQSLTDPERVLKVGIPVQRPWEAGKGGCCLKKKKKNFPYLIPSNVSVCSCLIIRNVL